MCINIIWACALIQLQSRMSCAISKNAAYDNTRFVASRHPAVLRGHATVEEVRQELLDTFFSAEGAGRGEGAGLAGVRKEDRWMLFPTKHCTTLATTSVLSTRMQVHWVGVPDDTLNIAAVLQPS